MAKNDIINQIRGLAGAENYLSVMAKYTLSNLRLITKLTGEEFIADSFTSKKLLNDFLLALNFAHYQDFCRAINIYLIENTSAKTSSTNNDQALIQKVYRKLFNSLELNYATLGAQENILTNVVQKIKGANRIYFFTNRNSCKIIEDFTNNLHSAGFKVNVVTNYVMMNDLAAKLGPKDLVFFIFDDFKNRPLFNVAKQFNDLQTHIIISKDSFHELNNLQGLKYLINYENFSQSVMFDMRKFSLMLILNLIFQKITATITSNYHQINDEFIANQIKKDQ